MNNDERPAYSREELIKRIRAAVDFEILEPLQENHRYCIYTIMHEGEKRMLKVSSGNEDLSDNLDRDMHMSMFLRSLRQANVTSTYKVRKIHVFGRGWYIGEYLEGPILLKEKEPEDTGKATKIARDVWGPFIAELTSYTPYFLLSQPYYIDKHGAYTSRYYQRHKELRRWSDMAKAKGLISATELRQVMDYIEGNARMVTGGLEMRDVKPWDTLWLDGDKVGLVDLEFSTITGRQFYDAAWSYLRFWFDIKQPEAACAFLKSFLERVEHENIAFVPQFLALFGMKLLGYMQDTADYMQQAEDGGDPPPFSREEMRDVLRRYLKFRLEALLE